jgi:hypothetical protein
MSFFCILLALLLLSFVASKPDWNQPDPSWLGDGPVTFPAVQTKEELPRYGIKSYTDQPCDTHKEITITTNAGYTLEVRITPNSDDIKPCEYGIQFMFPSGCRHVTDLVLVRIDMPLARNDSIVLTTTGGAVVLTPWCSAETVCSCTTTVSWTFTT